MPYACGMDEPKSSELKVNGDKPTGISSSAHGANVNALAFNIDFIASKNPTLALQIMKIYSEARKIHLSDPSYPEEDYSVVFEELKDLF